VCEKHVWFCLESFIRKDLVSYHLSRLLKIAPDTHFLQYFEAHNIHSSLFFNSLTFQAQIGLFAIDIRSYVGLFWLFSTHYCSCPYYWIPVHHGNMVINLSEMHIFVNSFDWLWCPGDIEFWKMKFWKMMMAARREKVVRSMTIEVIIIKYHWLKIYDVPWWGILTAVFDPICNKCNVVFFSAFDVPPIVVVVKKFSFCW
jgi:hypothetical protein